LVSEPDPETLAEPFVGSGTLLVRRGDDAAVWGVHLGWLAVASVRARLRVLSAEMNWRDAVSSRASAAVEKPPGLLGSGKPGSPCRRMHRA